MYLQEDRFLKEEKKDGMPYGYGSYNLGGCEGYCKEELIRKIIDHSF